LRRRRLCCCCSHLSSPAAAAGCCRAAACCMHSGQIRVCVCVCVCMCRKPRGVGGRMTLRDCGGVRTSVCVCQAGVRRGCVRQGSGGRCRGCCLRWCCHALHPPKACQCARAPAQGVSMCTGACSSHF
jgi:hypothetical protein